jgi:hypothetical protein
MGGCRERGGQQSQKRYYVLLIAQMLCEVLLSDVLGAKGYR